MVSRIYDPTAGSVTFDGQDLTAMSAHEISRVGVYRHSKTLPCGRV